MKVETLSFRGLPWLKIFFAWLTFFAAGQVWYLVFGEAWASGVGYGSIEEMVVAFGYLGSFLISAVINYFIAMVHFAFARALGCKGFKAGIWLSVWIGLFLYGVSITGGYIFLPFDPLVLPIDLGAIYIRSLIFALFATGIRNS